LSDTGLELKPIFIGKGNTFEGGNKPGTLFVEQSTSFFNRTSCAIPVEIVNQRRFSEAV